jgi:hypothetical protein
MVEQNSFFIVRTWIGIAVMLLIGIAFAPTSAFAQAADGPQSGATPSDQPSSTQHSVPQIGGHPSLAGTWTLNKDQSDDPRQKMREAMGGGGGNGGDGNGGGGNGNGGGGFGGRGMGGGRRGGGGGQGEMNAEFSQLTIAQTATSAKVTGSSGRVLAQYSSDNSSQSTNSANSNSGDANNADSGAGENQGAPAAAQWQGSQLVATTQGRRGDSTSRTYELSPDGTQLYVTTKMDNPRLQQPVTFRFVYDAAKSNGGANQ